jgi:hypothetical protein
MTETRHRRSVYKAKYRLSTTSWGSTFPGVTVYAVISEFMSEIDQEELTLSDLVHGHLACYQRLWRPLLPAQRYGVQISLHLGDGPAGRLGYWWSLLPEGHYPCLCGHLHPGSLPMHPFLLGARYEGQRLCFASGDLDDHFDCLHCKCTVLCHAHADGNRLRRIMFSSYRMDL